MWRFVPRWPTLPEGEEDDRLDHEKLEHGAVRAQQLPGGEVEQEEGVQRQADGDIVDDGHVQVTAGNTAEWRSDKTALMMLVCVWG